MPGRPIGVTMGEPAGIGGDITIKAWTVRRHRSIPPFFIIDDPERLEHLGARLGIKLPVKTITQPSETLEVFEHALPVLAHPLAGKSVPGSINGKNSEAVIASISRAVDLVLAGEAAAVVTNPIQKSALYEAGFKHPGHTEFLAELCQTRLKLETVPTPVMMLTLDDLRAVPATIHIPLGKVSDTLTGALITSTVQIMSEALKKDFAIRAPRIAVAGLNPHAGEDGALGDEEARIIAPAIQQLQAAGLDVSGPHPADTLFHREAQANYDAVLAMYHDQALIPIKALGFDRGVNVTLGLPIIRTSPDHGTALDLAGTGNASPASFIEALHTARFIADVHERQPAS